MRNDTRSAAGLIVAIVLLFFLSALVVMLLWNAIDLGPNINMWQAIGLMFLGRILTYSD